MNKILSIAGSDSCSIAGIQADIRTATRFNTYCATAITALTAQNSNKILAIQNADPLFFSKQLDALFSDIKFNAIKMIDIFKGEDNDFSKAVCLNTAAGLIINETYQNFADAYDNARKHILSNKVMKHLEKIQNA